jgi:PAS domain S-box-containing protein
MDDANLAHIRLLRQQLDQCRHDAALCLNIFQESPIGIAVYSPLEDGEDFVFVDLNPAGSRMLGMGRDAVRGRSLCDLFPGSRAMGLVDVLAATWRTGTPQRLSPREYRDSRLRLWAENHIVRLSSNHVVSFFLDVTPWVESRLEQRRGILRFRWLYSRLHEGFFFVTSMGTILDANAAAETLVGVFPGDLTGRSWRSLVSPRSQAMADTVEQVVQESGSAPVVEMDLVHSSGALVPVHLSAYREDEGWWAMVRDASQSRRLREALAWRDLEEHTLAQLGQELLRETDLAGMSRRVVEAAVALTGSHYGFVGFLDGDGRFVSTASSQTMEQCQVKDQSLIFRHLQGMLALGLGELTIIDDVATHPLARGLPPGHVPVDNLCLCPVRWAGQTIGLMGLANAPAGYHEERMTRVVERLGLFYALALRRHQEVQDRLEHERLLAEKSTATAQRLAAGFVQRLLPPAELLMELVGSLQERVLSPHLQGYVEGIVECARGIFQGLHQAHGLWSQDVGLRETVFDLHEALRTLVSRLRPQWAARGLELQLLLDPLVPQWVRADLGAILLVLDHLVANALAHTHSGGARVGVSALQHEHGERLELHLCVEDTGEGMPEVQQRAIAAFFAQGYGGGVGTGLVAVRRILAAMGGSFHLTSRLGHGTAVCISLPIGRAEPPRSGLRVLVVDDEPMQRQVLRRMLQHFGDVEIVEAETGSQALHLFTREPVQLIFLDLSLQDEDGLAVLGRMRAMEEASGLGRTPAWIVTAFEAKDLPPPEETVPLWDGVIHKPISPEALARALRQAGLPVDSEWDDTAALARLGGSAELLAEMRRIFLREAPQRLNEAVTAVEHGDVAQAVRAMHALKGNAATVGAMGLSALARAAHEALRTNQIAEATALIPAIQRSLDSVIMFLTSQEDQ